MERVECHKNKLEFHRERASSNIFKMFVVQGYRAAVINVLAETCAPALMSRATHASYPRPTAITRAEVPSDIDLVFTSAPALMSCMTRVRTVVITGHPKSRTFGVHSVFVDISSCFNQNSNSPQMAKKRGKHQRCAPGFFIVVFDPLLDFPS